MKSLNCSALNDWDDMWNVQKCFKEKKEQIGIEMVVNVVCGKNSRFVPIRSFQCSECFSYIIHNLWYLRSFETLPVLLRGGRCLCRRRGWVVGSGTRLWWCHGGRNRWCWTRAVHRCIVLHMFLHLFFYLNFFFQKKQYLQLATFFNFHVIL